MYIVVIQNEFQAVIGCYGPFDTQRKAEDWLKRGGLAYGRTGIVCMVHYAK